MGELVAVQMSRDVGPDVIKDQSLKALHCNGCHWSIVIETPNWMLLPVQLIKIILYLPVT